MLEVARHVFFQLRASCRTLSEIQRHWLQFFLIRKRRRRLFRGEAIGDSESDRRRDWSQTWSVKKGVDAMEVGFQQSSIVDDVGQRDSHCEADGSVQDEKDTPLLRNSQMCPRCNTTT